MTCFGVLCRLAPLLALMLGPLEAAPPLPLLFTPGAGGCVWQARSLDYGVCVGMDRILLRRAGKQVALAYEGRSGPLAVEPERVSAIRLSAFLGADPSEWRTGQAYEAVRIRALYPGIDAVLSGGDGALKIDYVVAPLANPGRIRLRFPGALGVEVGAHGGLVIRTEAGDWAEAAPVFYQPGGSGAVEGRVTAGQDGTASFEVGDYDRSRTLVIDPVLKFSSVIGGTGASSAEALALGPNGEIVVAGFTDAADFPAVNAQRSFAGGVEAVVLVLAPGGAPIQQATFLGGSGDDRAFAAAVDPEGGIYVAGWTTSSNFPLANAWRVSRAGARDAFVARIAPGGASLSFSTYLGGADVERATALAADAQGVWVAGETESGDFPLLAAYQSTPGGQMDGFLARFTKSGVAVSASYLGGAGADSIRALALSAAGEVYVAGGTFSANLPVPASGWRPAPGGGQDGFVLRLNSTAAAVTGGTYLGGSAGAVGDTELAQSLAVAANGDVVAGGTSPSSNFPLHQAWISAKRGTSMGFVTRLDAGLTQAVWSTYVGGGNTDRVEGVALDAQGRVYAAGRTFSGDLPLAAPLHDSYRGGGDAFLIVLDGAGAQQAFGTYIGGADSDAAIGVRVAPNGDAVVAGLSASQDFPAVNALQTPADSRPRFFVQVTGMGFHTPDPKSVTPAAAAGDQQSFEIAVEDGDGAANIKTVAVLIHSSFTSSNGCFITAEPGPGLLSLASDPGTQWTGATAGSSTILQNSQCQLRASGSGFSLEGVQLRVTLDLAFASSFAGLKQIYVLASDAQESASPWKILGTYTVAPPAAGAPPSPVSITPFSAAGLRQVFSLTVTDPQGGQDVKSAEILAAPAQATSQACRVRFTVSPPQIELADDAGTGWQGAGPGSGTVLQNSQCRVHAAGSGLAAGASAAVFWADIEFLPGWTGLRRLWGAAADLSNQQAGWTELAQYQATAALNQRPVISGFEFPPAGGGSFVVQAMDPDGGSSLRALHLLIGDGPPGSNACLIHFHPAAQKISLHPDLAGGAWPQVTPGQPGVAENARCRLRGEGSQLTVSGSQASYQIWIEFKAGFEGPKPVRAHVVDAAGTLSAPYRLLSIHSAAP